jgi:hypothetical protein
MNSDTNSLHHTGQEIDLKMQNVFSIFKRQLGAAPTSHKPVSIIIPYRPK